MHLITILLIGIIANIDNLAIGCSYGLKKTKISFTSNLIIALLSMLFSFLALLAGHWITHSMTSDFANALGGCLLLIIGGFTITSTFFERSSSFIESQLPFLKILYHPKKADLDENHQISSKEALLLGFSLALNSITTSFSVALTDSSFLIYTLSIGIFSFAFIAFGVKVGGLLQNKMAGLELLAPLLSGLLLILIGCFEMIS
ncbi:hypothetical protein GCM10011391_39380 [Pullulanibacillus camelliae]|uniref:Sporulation membrane protein YtaF n=1 Tax=Pullulanibacillus camelliae TaxID=1707096 RepID=A0A8J2YP99_9BACL|nr:manganese efflux pump [Pullulanibacillus camelliae]GGE56595.1 hypothetical protein GCM10011391_39380 [Pullulanibacillus camelliae]